ncbi:MAG: DUF938 domain-containing protein [Pseudomonadota bacterium]
MKPFAPACERNREPILQVLRPTLAQWARPRVLEIGSGTGQHGVFFAAALPHLTWIMSDRPGNHAGIEAWCDEAALANVEGPHVLDVAQAEGGFVPAVEVVYSANTAHIMSWPEVMRMMAIASGSLLPGGCLLLYGPFKRGGEHTSEGNERFDRSLRESAPHMGIRDLEAVDGLAAANGLTCEEVHEMPANNLTVRWRREAGGV